jgi:hypothetical protein
LRKGVKFHDGTDFNAHAFVFTLGRIFDDKSPQFDAAVSPIVRSTVRTVCTIIDKAPRHEDEAPAPSRRQLAVRSGTRRPRRAANAQKKKPAWCR